MNLTSKVFHIQKTPKTANMACNTQQCLEMKLDVEGKCHVLLKPRKRFCFRPLTCILCKPAKKRKRIRRRRNRRKGGKSATHINDFTILGLILRQCSSARTTVKWWTQRRIFSLSIKMYNNNYSIAKLLGTVHPVCTLPLKYNLTCRALTVESGGPVMHVRAVCRVKPQVD